jgi:hypothetical protein
MPVSKRVQKLTGSGLPTLRARGGNVYGDAVDMPGFLDLVCSLFRSFCEVAVKN